jgi:hypothetical protein
MSSKPLDLEVEDLKPALPARLADEDGLAINVRVQEGPNQSPRSLAISVALGAASVTKT